jgi:hypothetical protein
MPTFDRFDICGAYLAVENDWNEGGILKERGRDYSIGVQLDRMDFKAGAAWNGFESLSRNGQEIYNALCERLMLGDGGYKDCSCRDCFEIAIGRGHPLCNECAEAGCEGGETECQAPGAYGADEEEEEEGAES